MGPELLYAGLWEPRPSPDKYSPGYGTHVQHLLFFK
jgi:hypothetical protein